MTAAFGRKLGLAAGSVESNDVDRERRHGTNDKEQKNRNQSDDEPLLASAP